MLRAAANRRGSQSVLFSEVGKYYDKRCATGVAVFRIMYFHKLIHQPFDDKHGLASHEKLEFKMTKIVCVIQSVNSSQTGSNNYFPFPIYYCSYFFRSTVPWVPLERCLAQALYQSDLMYFHGNGDHILKNHFKFESYLPPNVNTFSLYILFIDNSSIITILHSRMSFN